MYRCLILPLAVLFCALAYGQRLQDEAMVKWITSLEGLNFKMDREDFICCDSSIISTHVAYVRKKCRWAIHGNPDPYVTYNWMRFSTDGRVCISLDYATYPTFEEMNDFTYVKYGRYRIEKDRLVVEWSLSKDLKNYFKFARKVPSGIEFYAESPRRHARVRSISEEGGIYEKSSFNFSTWPESNRDN